MIASCALRRNLLVVIVVFSLSFSPLWAASSKKIFTSIAFSACVVALTGYVLDDHLTFFVPWEPAALLVQPDVPVERNFSDGEHRMNQFLWDTFPDFMLLSHKEVRSELEISVDQAVMLKKVEDELVSYYGNLIRREDLGRGNFAELEQHKREVWLRATQVFHLTLTNSQFHQLISINAKRRGFAAMALNGFAPQNQVEESVAQFFSLSARQLEQLQELQAKYRTEYHQINGIFLPGHEWRKRTVLLQQTRESDVMAILTPSQRRRWRNAQPSFDLSVLRNNVVRKAVGGAKVEAPHFELN